MSDLDFELKIVQSSVCINNINTAHTAAATWRDEQMFGAKIQDPHGDGRHKEAARDEKGSWSR